jgi:glycosyltransferase involved in cell wall biosynthesis
VEFLVTRRFHAEFQEKAMLEKLEAIGDPNVITFIPNVSGKMLPQVVRKAGIALSVDQPSRIGLTSQPTKTFEYMSQALPIVASELPNTVEYVGNTGCGILVKPDDPNAYADAIIRLIENPDLARRMGQRGQQLFKEQFNWSVVEKRLVEFYDKVANEW